MAFSNSYTMVFALGICAACSLAVASAAQGLKDLQDVNKRRDVQANILKSVNLPENGIASGEAVDALYSERIEVEIFDAQGQVVDGKTEDDWRDETKTAKLEGRNPTLFAVFKRMDNGDPVAYSFPVDGKGLWGPISGYVSLEGDAATVAGATFFAPKETPGLGLEITNEPFTSQWSGKRMVASSGDLEPVTVIKGKIADGACTGDPAHCVDGVSGATITSRGVTEMVDRWFHLYEPYLNTLRRG